MITFPKMYFFVLALTMLTLSFIVVGCEEEDNGTDGPPWSCYFDTNLTQTWLKGCFQYDDSVTKEEAEAECATHQIGGMMDMAENRTLKGGPCSIDRVSGYCEVPTDCTRGSCPPLPGKEWTQYRDAFYEMDAPYGDCITEQDDLIDNLIGGGFSCSREDMAAGTYTCYYNEDSTLKEEYADEDGTLKQPLPL